MADQTQILEHLGYEWWMFRQARELARSAGNTHSAARNAFVESTLIHGRALVQFFYFPKNGTHKDTDWNVTDLGLRLFAQVPPVLKTWYEDTGKHVAHLTEHRINSLETLPDSDAAAELDECITRVKAHPGIAIPTDWIGDRATPTDPFGSPPTNLGPTGASGPVST
jgi:hypothetical protein